MYVIEYTACPPRMFLELIEIARDNENDKLRRMWQANYLRVTDEMKRR